MNLNRFQKTALLTLFATLVLILIGGLVRAAGAGLGCPDWPKCFGMWIPPVSAAELPAGFDPIEFNPVHTWLEYVNRLAGVLIGLLITITFVFSFRYRKERISVTVASGIAFLLVLFQGWLGGQVVKSGLMPGMITIHMVVAMIILNTLLFACFSATKEKIDVRLSASVRKNLLWGGGVLIFLSLLQLVLGTQVREEIDVIKNMQPKPSREIWLGMTSLLYDIHRSFSWAVVAVSGGLVYYLYRKKITGILNIAVIVTFGLILLQMLIGLGMDKLGIPAALQVLHLVSVAVLFCAEFVLMLIAWFAKKVK